MHLLSLSLCVLRHPIDTFHVIQRTRERFSFAPAIILLFLAAMVRLMFIQTVHYPLQTTDPRFSNWMMESLMLLVPVLSLAVCGFAITSIMEGEMMMREALTGMAYCLVPYVVFIMPLAAASHLMGLGNTLFTLMESFIWGWCVVLYFISIKTMNSYTFAKTVLVLLLTVLLMALMWAVLLLLWALWNQLADFVTSIWRELKFVMRR